ncbi:hypothetical protein [Accumulibacter sp.]|uniref:hypothetical protein n=1 Tax=Accumulibacter sp. TaxID=2053492 RepID=UPI0025D35402|nr:hypothetical protein [Accumulibacter sp.]MCM8595667.1 hypothetical protein [Accumulibacter sp.]MCM8625989.1 hypothetical protein [Accumulibacter sp.]MDS4049814.1 hypothetical protein [Accumulibacter sp.]
MFEHLTTANPGHAVWQRDLSVSHLRTGDMSWEMDEFSQAAASYEAALGIFERRTRSDEHNARWLTGLAYSRRKHGMALRQLGQRDAAPSSFDAARDICERLVADSRADTPARSELAVAHVCIADALKE